MKKRVSLLLVLAMLLSLSSAALASEVPEDAPVIVLYQNSGASHSGTGSEAGSTDAGYQLVQD